MVDAGILVWVQTCKLLLPDVDHVQDRIVGLRL